VFKMIAEIAILGSPVRKTFDYIIPNVFKVSIGQRVIVDFANRLVTGIVIDIKKESVFSDLKTIEDVVEVKAYLSTVDIQLAKLASDYFLSPIGKILEASFPPKMRFKVKEVLIKRSEIVPGFLKNEKSLLKDEYLRRFSDRRKGLKLLSELIDRGLIDVQFSYPQVISKQKTSIVKKVSLNTDIRKLLRNRRLSRRRMEIINYLLLNDESELIKLKKDLRLKDLRIVRSLEKEGILKIVDEEVKEGEYFTDHENVSLTDDQSSIVEAIEKKKNLKHYLYGVTGSGKTEIYFNLMKKVLKEDSTVLYLIPEISLTPQMIYRIKSRFPNVDVAVYHSNLKSRERLLEWLKVINNNAKIILGTRSAVWLPIRDLGLVIVDEEHDESYYQKDMEPIYDAVKIAKWKSELYDALLVMGSATPNVSRFFLSKRNNFSVHYLKERPSISKLPKVEIIDMKKTERYNWIFSKRLVEEIRNTVEAGKQVFLFTHRKGFSSYVICANCGYVYKCKNCDVAMTYHYSIKALKCHYCGNLESVPDKCPVCGSKELISRGFGTERVEREILKMFPNFRIIRMDRDNIKSVKDLEEVLKLIKEHHVDIVVGTKMIAKGLDFPNVTLVGVISADQLLNFPDYTASERTFETISQVAGRSGRGSFEGKVIIQTFNPEASAISYAVNHDYLSFYEKEIRNRKKLNYPPFNDLVNLVIENSSKEKAEMLSKKIFELLKDGVKGELLGPVEALIFKLRNKYRYNLIVKTTHLEEDLKYLKKIIDKGNLWNTVKIFINPPNLF